MNQATTIRRQQWRTLKDTIARYGVAIGGVSVIIAILLIFFYLLYVVVPLFKPAEMNAAGRYPVPGPATQTAYLAMEEQTEIGLRLTRGGQAVFFNTKDGSVVKEQDFDLPAGATVTSFAAADPAKRTVAFGLSNGQALVVRPVYKVTYPNDQRVITPDIDFPLGEEPIVVDEDGAELRRLAVETGEERATLAAVTAENRVVIANLSIEESFLGEGKSIEQSNLTLEQSRPQTLRILVDKDQQELYVANRDGEISYFDITDPSEPTLVHRVNVVAPGATLSSLEFLAGGISLMVGDSQGTISQWFPVRDDDNNYRLTHIRSFDAQHAAISGIAPEFGRKGFLAIDTAGRLGIYHTTAERTLLVRQVADSGLSHAALAPRANAALVEDGNNQLSFWRIRNEHPEVSWSSLWGKVWYESYQKPAKLWQSSSASNDFEPKFSLAPLAFGTLKAAFYAMALAVPLSIMGAIYTAYFMAPRMRRLVKPTVEIMEALPTVILGFLAGLWLAPFLERYMPGSFALLVLMPVGLLVFAFVWQKILPEPIRHKVPEGWYAALLIPVVLFLGWLSFAISVPLEQWLFGGDMRGWLTNQVGIDYDQRNAIVVGFAMGFAVIPTIFSITEDAIFSVPKHLTQGSLALGATSWQTLARVVILTASPGIFSAVMIGLGRAVGETMIVLMATGNTPVMDMSIFQGMRTLSANIAVEMPESEVNSTHFRVLFLAAMVLFLFTFLFNTLAEIIRQRLRRKYSSL